ncbi:MAG TPA: hypothetical protein VFP54_05645 [Acidimicrobiales bacterium]|nr:hypothetical protein [Acidimicrobiales bacterium]
MIALVVAIGLFLSLPVVTGVADGQIDPVTAVVRVALAFGASWIGVSLVRAVVAHYASPAPDGAPRRDS